MDKQAIYSLYLQSEGVSTDTRTLKEGQLFFALSGPNFNGNEFAQEALEKGAAAAVCDDGQLKGPRIIQSNNSLLSLQELARYHRDSLEFPIIGLTGSNGKTTSKEILVSVLGQKFKVGATAGNLNNHIGVPLSILNLPRDTQIAIIEMGANHQGEIAFLSDIAKPDHGFITNYGKAHLEGFGGVQGIIKGKSELYENLGRHGNTAWINIEDPIQKERSEGLKRFFFGDSDQADYTIRRAKENNEGQVAVTLDNERIQSQLFGDFNFGNLAVAAALGKYFGLSKEDIKAGIEQYAPRNNRSQREKGRYNELIRDYYNANPNSMQGAIENFARLNGDSKWLILGDMFELGEEARKEHQAIVDLINEYPWERVMLIGEHFAALDTEHQQLRTTNEAVALMEAEKPKEKIILLKGSRGMQLERVADLL